MCGVFLLHDQCSGMFLDQDKAVAKDELMTNTSVWSHVNWGHRYTYTVFTDHVLEIANITFKSYSRFLCFFVNKKKNSVVNEEKHENSQIF